MACRRWWGERQTLARCRPKPEARIYHPPEERKPNPLTAVIRFKIIPDHFLPTFCRLLGESEPSFLAPRVLMVVWRLNVHHFVWMRIMFHMYQQLCMKMHDAWCPFSMSVITLIFSLFYSTVMSSCYFKPLHAADAHVIHVGLFFWGFFILWHAYKQIQVLLPAKKSVLKLGQQSSFLRRGQRLRCLSMFAPMLTSPVCY